MGENPKLGDIGSESMISSCKSEKLGAQKISVSDQPNTVQFTNFKPDSFIVDMERLSHLTDKDTTGNSRITLQRSLSRKLSQQQQRGMEKKMNPSNNANEKDNRVAPASSPRAGASTPEKPMVVTIGTTDRPVNSQVHHQITIMTGKVGATSGEARGFSKRPSFRRSSASSWTLDPRRILIFFATLSSMGTMLLIYFTLTMGRASSGDDSAQNW